MVALIFCKTATFVSIPKPDNYPHSLDAIGDHIRKRRIDSGLYQKEVAEIIGVTEDTITYWENKRSIPQVHHMPNIIDFLGYNQYEQKAGDIVDVIIALRMSAGLTQRQTANVLHINPSTLGLWEARKRTPSRKLKQQVNQYLVKLK